MSYYEQAEKINTDLKQLFNSIYIKEFTIQQREQILNLMIRLGQVAKFRCRNNSAYDSFISACFRDIATCERVPIREGEDYEVLTATLNPITAYFDFLSKNNLQDTKESFTQFVKSINQNMVVI